MPPHVPVGKSRLLCGYGPETDLMVRQCECRTWLVHGVCRYSALLEGRASGDSAAGLPALLSAASPGRQEPLWQELGGLCVPALFVAGAQDAKFTALARRMAGLAAGKDNWAAVEAEGLHQGVQVEIVGECGHAVHIERPEVLALTLSRFIFTGAAASS